MAQEAAPGSGPASTSRAAAAPLATLGRYRLLQKIARGGMAEVYLARSYGAHGFEKTVAIKRILARYGNEAQFVRMLVDEAKISVLLNHPNIAQVLELGEHEGDYFIVMEFVPGHALAALVKRMREIGERMGVLEAAFVLVEMLQGLHAAHIQREPSGRPANIIHRDVSPQNVLLSRDGHVKLIDFGIARAKDRLEATEVGTIKGKLRYLAPEMIDPARFSNGSDFDHRVDIFAAGICLHELVAGRPLFQGSNDVEVYESITQGGIPDLHAEGVVDELLGKIITKSLERYPADRYATAEAMADDLRAYLYRQDPGFTHKRVGALVQRFFATELRALERAEETSAESSKEKPELVLTRSVMIQQGDIVPSRPARGDERSRSDERDRPRSDERQRADDRVPSDPARARATASDPRMVSQPRQLVSDPNRLVTARPNEPTMIADSLPRDARDPSFSEHTPLDGDENPDVTVTGSGDAVAASTESVSTSVPSLSQTMRVTGRQQRSPMRIFWISAITGIAVSLLIVGILEVTRPPPQPTNPQPPPPVVVDVRPPPTGVVVADARLLVNVRPSTARVRRLDAQSEVLVSPALFTVTRGSTVELEVTAPGYETKRERVNIPQGEENVRVDVDLQADAVPIAVHATPDRALVRVDGRPLEPDMKVKPGVEVGVDVSAPGYAPQHRIVVPEPGVPLVVDVELARTGPGRDRPERPERPEPAATGRSVLVLTSSPYWGRVIIDGQTLEETTPTRVELKSGVHEIVITHPPKGLERRFRINLKPGETARRAITF